MTFKTVYASLRELFPQLSVWWATCSSRLKMLFIHQGIAKRLVAADIQEAAKKKEVRYKDIKKIEKGIRRHFHDDITVIVIYLDRQTTFSIPKHNKQGTVGYTTPPINIYSHNSDERLESSGDKIFPNEESRANVLY